MKHKNISTLTLILSLPILLGGCAAAVFEVATEMAFPTAIQSVVGELHENEKSFPVSAKLTLALSQQALKQLNLKLDVVEFQDKNNYGLFFHSDELSGKMTIHHHTSQLSTIYLKVRKISRQASVENLIFETIDKKLNSNNRQIRFRSRGYNNLRAEPTTKSARIGLYRKSAQLDVKESQTRKWLEIKLPSRNKAYLKAKLSDFQK